MLGLYPTAWRDRHEPAFRAMLDAEPASFADLLDIGIGAATAHLNLSRKSDSDRRIEQRIEQRIDVPPTTSRAHHSEGWMQALFIHAGLFVMINVILAAINLLTGAANLWFPYPLWGTAIVLTAHLAATWPGRDYLRAHAMLASVIAIGLIGIDRATGDPSWAIWPVWAMASLLLVHALRSSGRIGDFGTHALLIVLGGVELLAVNLVAPGAAPELIWVIGYALVTLLAHALLTFGTMRLLPVHIITFVFLNLMFFIDSMDEGGHPWFQYPLVATSILLTAHILVETRGPSLLAGGRFADLAAASGTASAGDSGFPITMPASSEASAAAMASRRHVRGFLIHAGLFAIALIELAAINLLSAEGGFWMIWPLGVWLVILSAHAGSFVTPGHPLLGIHAFGGAATAVGLIAIDISTDGGPWALWPIIAWLVVLAIHAGATGVSNRAPSGAGGRSLFRAHLAATVTAIGGLLALVATGVGGVWVVWPIWGLLIVLGAHVGITAIPTRPFFGIWLVAGGIVMAGLAMIDRATGGGVWAFWPAIVWLLGAMVIFGLTIDLNQVMSSEPGSAPGSASGSGSGSRDLDRSRAHDRQTAPE